MKHFNFVNIGILSKIKRSGFCIILNVFHALACSVYYLGSMVMNINAFAD